MRGLRWLSVPVRRVPVTSPAWLRRRFDHGPGPPPIEDFRGDVAEQVCRQIQRPDRLEFVDLGHHRFQAHVARAALDQSEQRRGLLVHAVVVVILVDGDDAEQAARRRCIQSAGDPRRPILFGCAQGRSNHPLYPAGRRWLDP